MRSYMLLVCLLAVTLSPNLFGQDLEPRRWSPIPTDMQVVGVGYGVAASDISFDPVMQIENGESTLHALGVSYVTSFKLADKLARFDMTVPWGHGKWEGLLASEQTELKRVGLLDPVLRLSVNLMGSPPLETKKLIPYLNQKKTNTIVGAAISVAVPLGEYHNEKLINLGQNRYTIRPQIGIVHTRDAWSYELTGSVFFYTDNDEFYPDSLREQKPLYAVQAHVVHSLDAGKWLSASVGYGLGGQSTVNGQNKDDKKHTVLSALSFGMPISRTQSVKIAYLYRKTNSSTGINSDSLLIAWSKRF